MSDVVTITTGARLHFGLLVGGEPSQRSYGGIGLMIDQPRYSLTIRPADQDRIQATPATKLRIQEFLRRLRGAGSFGPAEIVVHEEIPAHAGLGSGTQLGLALATGLGQLQGESDIPIEELARRLGRSTRSVIGTVGFQAGGLIAHGGSQNGTASVAPVRQEFPAEWRFLLITPPDQPGLSGESESNAFRNIPPMSDRQLQCLSNLQQQIMLAANDRDFQTFSGALSEFGQSVGEYFAPFQSGVFANPGMAALARQLQAEGIRGIGQTSWGPTLFALCNCVEAAESVGARIHKSSDWSDCELLIVAARNQGAETSLAQNLPTRGNRH